MGRGTKSTAAPGRAQRRGGKRKRSSRKGGSGFSRLRGLLAERPAMLAGLGLVLLGLGIAFGAVLGDGEAQSEPVRTTAEASRPKPATASAVRPPPPANKMEVAPKAQAPAKPTPAGPAAEYEEPIPEALASLPHSEPEPLQGVRITDTPVTLAAPPKPAPERQEQTAAPAPARSAPQVAALPRLPGDLWLRNAVAAPSAGGKPMVAIVIDDMGIDRRRSRKVLDLPGPITAAYLTYAKDVRTQAREARAKGKELLVHMPMEPESDVVDPGPDVLRAAMREEEIRGRVAAGLDAFDGYVGINNHMGSRFTADPEAMRPVMEELKRRGLLWLDSRTTADSKGAHLAKDLGVPYAERHVFLDHDESLAGVTKQLAELERLAKEHGYAIAIGHPKDNTITALSRWLPTLEGKGLVLVPLSAIVRLRTAGG